MPIWTSTSRKSGNSQKCESPELDGDKLIEKLPPYDWDGKDYSFLTSPVVEPNIYTKCKDKDPVIESKYGEALSLLDKSASLLLF